MLSVLSISPSGDFDLKASIRFSEGWEPAAIAPSAGGAPMLRLTFAVDGWGGHAAVALTQDAGGVVHGELAGTGDPAFAWRQALRIVALHALPRDEALAALEEVRGIGPFSARLVLIRGTGATDVAATEEPRVRARIAELYGADADPEAVADGWRPFRTWVAVLLRSSAR